MPWSRIPLDRKVPVKSLTMKAFILLFVALVVQCALDGPGTEIASRLLLPDGGAFCGTLSGASVVTNLPAQLFPQPSSGQFVGPLPEIQPAWLLAQSIDHPPERSV